MSTCPHCDEQLDGLLAHAQHSCFIKQVEYRPMSNIELRQWMIEQGMPTMMFMFFELEPPTDMERQIFEKEPEPEPEPEQVFDEVADFLFDKLTDDERFGMLKFAVFPIRGFRLHLEDQRYRLQLLEKYAPGSELHLNQISIVKRLENF